MADEEINLDELDENINNNNRVEQRLRSLTEKVKLTERERDEKAKLLQEKETEVINANKERDFYSKFSDSTNKYPDAHAFKDKIREKVMAGYDVEDATVAVLAKEGKFGTSTTVVEKETVAGGSAATAIKGEGEKSLSEMTREEKRASLMETPGDLEKVLRQG
jgi:hypothetical protein